MNYETKKNVIYLKPKRKSFKHVYIGICLALVVAAIWMVSSMLRDKVYIVNKGNISESLISDAIILRDETVIHCPAEGNIQLLVKPGERVRVGTPLFMVVTDSNQKENYEKEISALDEKIKEIQQKHGSQMSLNLINKSIDDITKKLKDAVANGQFEKVKTLKSELERLTSEKQKALDVGESNLDVLKKNHDKLKDELRKIELLAYAPTAGLVSFTIDGFEQRINQDNVNVESYSQIEQLKVDPCEIDLSSSVKANDAVLKIIDNFSWCIVSKIEKNMEKGKYYNIKFEEIDNKINAKLVDTIDANDERLGIFSFERDFPGFLDLRKTRAEIITKVYTGNIIPLAGIVTKDDNEGVYVLHKRRKIFKPVKVIAKDDQNAVVDGLKTGDRILTNMKR
jgi:putative membrane fusion protein